MKPDFKTVFWIINQEMFKPKLSRDWLDKKVEENLEYIQYQKVIPVYVKCISNMYDGTTQFDITPVDIRDGETKNWRWSRSINDDDIGKSVFETEEEALAEFKRKFSEEQRSQFLEKDKFRRLQK